MASDLFYCSGARTRLPWTQAGEPGTSGYELRFWSGDAEWIL